MTREITLYSKERCAQCNASQRELKKIGVEFTEYGDRVVLGETTYIYADATAEDNRDFVIGLGHMAAPVMTVVVDGELTDHWSGYIPDKIQEHAVEVLV